MKRFKSIFVIIFILGILFLSTSCNKYQKEINGFAFDSPYSIKASTLKSANIKLAEDCILKCDKLFDAYDENSDISYLNKNKSLLLADDNKMLFDAIKKSHKFCNDFFDISIRPATVLWNFNDDNPKIPEESKIAKAIKKVNYNNIVIEDNKITLKNDCSIEPGAFAKGYCADRVYDILKNDNSIIDIGGTVISSKNEPITVGVKNPSGDGLLCKFQLESSYAVSTSGSYERYFIKDNKLYHHILNPKTGYSFESDFVSVTVICKSAFLADILSTTYFAQGKDCFDNKLAKGAIFVTKDNNVYLKGDIDIKDLNKDFTIIK